jgi:hypothetical protein
MNEGEILAVTPLLKRGFNAPVISSIARRPQLCHEEKTTYSRC